MHTFETPNTTFHFNSDMSGEVELVRPDGRRLKVPGCDLLSFVAEIVRRDRVSQLEVLSDAAVLGLKHTII